MTAYLLPENALEVYRGSSRTLSLVVSTSSGAVNLTGAFVYFTVKRRIQDPIPLVQKTSVLAEQITLVAPRLGQVEIYLLPADTAHLDVGVYVFDVWVVLADGRRCPVVLPSSFEVLPSVTVLS